MIDITDKYLQAVSTALKIFTMEAQQAATKFNESMVEIQTKAEAEIDHRMKLWRGDNNSTEPNKPIGPPITGSLIT